MDNFPKNLAEVRVYLSKLKAWAVIATLTALLVVSFYSFEGWRYWQAWEESKLMSQQIDQINTKLNKGTSGIEVAAGDLDLHQQRLEYFESMFNESDSNSLIGILSNISWDTEIELPTISAGEPTFENIGPYRYKTQPISLAAQGDIEDIYRFVSTLQEELPIVSVTNLSISDPGEEAKAQIQLVFYISPQLIADAEGVN